MISGHIGRPNQGSNNCGAKKQHYGPVIYQKGTMFCSTA